MRVMGTDIRLTWSESAGAQGLLGNVSLSFFKREGLGMSGVGRTHGCFKFRIDKQVATPILPATQLPKRQPFALCNAAQATLACLEHVLLSHRIILLAK